MDLHTTNTTSKAMHDPPIILTFVDWSISIDDKTKQNKMKFTHTFKTTAYDVEMDTTIGIDPRHHSGGWYESYDVETGGDRFYAGGVLETLDTSDGDGNEAVALVGYDGCFELPEYIIEALEKKGVIIDL